MVPWWPVPKASAASISMPMRLTRTRARSCAPCTTKRPASTGARPSRLLRTQSVGASVSNASPCAAAAPATDAICARTAASSGRSRKWMASDQRPSGSSNAETATSSASGALGERIGDFLGDGGIGREPCDHGGGGDGRRLKHGSVSFVLREFAAVRHGRGKRIHTLINTLAGGHPHHCPQVPVRPVRPALFSQPVPGAAAFILRPRRVHSCAISARRRREHAQICARTTRDREAP